MEPLVPSSLLIRMHREMLRVRVLDDKMVAMQRQGRVGFYGASTGQEAVPVGAALALEPSDWIVPALREGAAMLVRGFDLRTYVAQIFGNERDLLKGRQMPSHMSGRSVHQVSWSSCIGTQLPHAVGIAMAMRARGEPAVCLGFIGDGGTSTSDFHAAMNFAAVFRAPCVIVCQNNQWSISLPVSRQTASATLAEKAAAYGTPALRVDGNDVVAVYMAVAESVNRARSGGGPSFVECVTYRMGPHSSSDDPDLYRSRQEVEEWKRRDPIASLEQVMTRDGLADAQSLAAVRRELETEVDQAIDEVEGAPAPPIDSLFDDVYARLPWHLRDQRDALGSPHPGPPPGLGEGESRA